jgi:ABC-type uncharacterized transport system substrate-binding protein
VTTRRLFLAASCGAVAALLRPRGAAAAASGVEVRILVAADDNATRAIVRSLAVRFPTAKSSSAVETLSSRHGPAVYVTVGATALQNFVDAGVVAPVVATFLSNDAFTRIKVRLLGDRRFDLMTAIYAEAAPASQLQLVRALYGRRVLVGVLLGMGTAHIRPLIEAASKATGLDVDVRVVAPSDNILRSFAAMRDVRALLTVPDRDLYTPETARYLLESSYRRNVGVIGFSTDLVRAGALATAYSSIDDVTAQLPSVVEAAGQGRIPAAGYPNYWRIDINERIAQSLSLVVDDHLKALGNIPGGTP